MVYLPWFLRTMLKTNCVPKIPQAPLLLALSSTQIRLAQARIISDTNVLVPSNVGGQVKLGSVSSWKETRRGSERRLTTLCDHYHPLQLTKAVTDRSTIPFLQQTKKTARKATQKWKKKKHPLKLILWNESHCNYNHKYLFTLLKLLSDIINTSDFSREMQLLSYRCRRSIYLHLNFFNLSFYHLYSSSLFLRCMFHMFQHIILLYFCYVIANTFHFSQTQVGISKRSPLGQTYYPGAQTAAALLQCWPDRGKILFSKQAVQASTLCSRCKCCRLDSDRGKRNRKNTPSTWGLNHDWKSMRRFRIFQGVIYSFRFC